MYRLTTLLISSISSLILQLPADTGTATIDGHPVDVVAETRIKPFKPLSSDLRPLAKKVIPKPKTSQTPKVSAGNCELWLKQAGVKELAAARELIRRESGCNPYARNPSSGACGVAQELPCGKSGCALGDGLCQVKWMDRYCRDVYGSWSAALAHHDANNWY